MKRHNCFAIRTAFATCLALNQAAFLRAADIESFEFNDPTDTELSGAANAANPSNGWLEDSGNVPSGMLPSDIRNGSYNIVKPGPGLVSNYFQVANITSGTRYLVATMSGWDFPGMVESQEEEFRLAFMNDDDENFGSTITAQMTIRRNAEAEMELVGTALGDGSSNIDGVAPLSTTQSAPFTLVLELDKSSNSYQVFYKNGTSPTQVLGLGSVAPARGGNSVRMAVFNDFGDFSLDYPAEYFDFLSVDRIAVTDTNPLADLITLEIDRVSGAMTLRNTSGATISDVESYSVISATGSLNPIGWAPLGNNVTSASSGELAEAFAPAIDLAVDQNNTLSSDDGAWLQSPFEDVRMELSLAGGETRTVDVNFVGNSGAKWQVGDLNFDNQISVTDWELFYPHAETNLTALSRAATYRRGDLDGDGQNSIADFIHFKSIYNAANGDGAFEAMVAGVPEPSCLLLLAIGATAIALADRRPARDGRQ